MKPTPAATARPIRVDALCVGMDIRVDGSWLSHPFPRSRFRIETDVQLAALRALGLRTVLLYEVAGEPMADGEQPSVPSVPSADVADVSVAPSAPVRRLEHGRRSQDDEPVRLSERERQAACERRHAAVTSAHREVLEAVHDTPRAARAQIDALVVGLLQDIKVDDEISIRLLQHVGDDALSTHSVNVAVVSLLMGRSFGFDEAELRDLGVGALLHDIGKLGLPPQLQRAATQMTSAEMALYQSHVARGIAYAADMGLSGGAVSVIAHHHEHMDGGGFPARLKSDDLPVGARIVALVNRYDRLCNPRDPTTALSPHDALSLLFSQNRGRFDTSILAAFIKLIGVYPPGSTVQLTDNRYALVTAINSARPLKPCVVPYDAQVRRSDAVRLDLQKTADIGIVRSVRARELPPKVLAYLAPPQRTAYFFEASEFAALAA